MATSVSATGARRVRHRSLVSIWAITLLLPWPLGRFRWSAHAVAPWPRGAEQSEHDADDSRGAQPCGRAQTIGARHRLLHSFLRKLQRAVSFPKARRFTNSGNLRPGLARTSLHLHVFLPSSRGAAARRTHRKRAGAFHGAGSISRGGSPVVGQRRWLELLSRSMDRRSHRQLSGAPFCRQPKERQSFFAWLAHALPPAPG